MSKSHGRRKSGERSKAHETTTTSPTTFPSEPVTDEPTTATTTTTTMNKRLSFSRSTTVNTTDINGNEDVSSGSNYQRLSLTGIASSIKLSAHSIHTPSLAMFTAVKTDEQSPSGKANLYYIHTYIDISTVHI